MLVALSKFLPRVFHKRGSSRSTKSSVTDEQSSTSESGRQFSCSVMLLDDEEIQLDVKVCDGRIHENLSVFYIQVHHSL